MHCLNSIIIFIPKQFLLFQYELSPNARKPVFGTSDQVRHKPGCTVTEDGYRLEILDLESRGTVLSEWRKQGADQLRSYCEADLRLCFRLCRLLVFQCGGSMNVYAAVIGWQTCRLDVSMILRHPTSKQKPQKF